MTHQPVVLGMTVSEGGSLAATTALSVCSAKGGMARVYLVTHSHAEALCLEAHRHRRGLSKPKGDFIARFRQEATVLARLHHAQHRRRGRFMTRPPMGCRSW